MTSRCYPVDSDGFYVDIVWNCLVRKGRRSYRHEIRCQKSCMASISNWVDNEAGTLKLIVKTYSRRVASREVQLQGSQGALGELFVVIIE